MQPKKLLKKQSNLDAAKKAVSTKEANLSGKKAELEKIISETEKEEKHYNKDAAEARGHVDERLLTAMTVSVITTAMAWLWYL